MKFYAYIPNENGSAPCGTDKQTLFELKTVRGAIQRCNRIFGRYWKLYRYANVFNENTYDLVAERK